MRGKYSPTVNSAYSKDQEWWNKFSHNPDSTVHASYDPEGFDRYGYNAHGFDRARNHEREYAFDTHGEENSRFNEVLDNWGFDGVKPVLMRVITAPVCPIGDKKCKPCEGGVAPLTEQEIAAQLGSVVGWSMAKNEDGVPFIKKYFKFKNHYELISFINALAWVSHREDHHPQVTMEYADCTVRYWTFAIGGLSENDFICAAKVDKILAV